METMVIMLAILISPVVVFALLSLLCDGRRRIQAKRDYRNGWESAENDMSFGLMSERIIRSEAWHQGYDDELFALSVQRKKMTITDVQPLMCSGKSQNHSKRRRQWKSESHTNRLKKQNGIIQKFILTR